MQKKTRNCSYLDLTGQKFNRLTVISLHSRRPKIQWKCKCDCGSEKITTPTTYELTSNHTKSCGCIGREKRIAMNKSQLIDLIGKKFGRLLVLERDNNDNKYSPHWKCQCDCGNIKIVSSSALRSKNHSTKSCGCLKREMLRKNLFIDLTGQIFNRLKVIELDENRSSSKNGTWWICECICENIVSVKSPSLRNGRTQSCGCIRIELMKSKKKENHYRWNPNISNKIREDRRYLHEFVEWRKLVFERDNYTCILSGIQGDVNAHHLYAWKEYPNERFNINNGVTISEKLHKLFHSIYGRGSNTPNQFEEFKTRYQSGEFNYLKD